MAIDYIVAKEDYDEYMETIKNQKQEIERLKEELQIEKSTNKELLSTGADLENKLYEEQDKNKRLNNIINELEEYLIEQVEKSYSNDYDNVLDKLDELKESNETSFEEMVGFVENVCKDIKNQSTLHEELEEERKTIAKIVGDFKEVNK